MPTVVRWARRANGRRGPWHDVIWETFPGYETKCGRAIPFPEGGRIDTAADPPPAGERRCKNCARKH